MKTSTIEVRDMLSVLTVDEVEMRIGKVPGVESATVNYTAGNATVRYDETLVEVADIKVIVHQRGQQPSGGSQLEHGSEDKPTHEHAVEPKPEAVPASASKPQPAVPKAAPVPPAKTAPAASAVDVPESKPAQGAPRTLVVAINALMLKRIKLEGSRQSGQTAAPEAFGERATAEPTNAPAMPAKAQQQAPT